MGTATYLASEAKLPYCRGCGHALVVRQLSQALERLALPPRSVALTTDIGCVGLADSLFPYLHTVHTTHGRSTAMAIGMALAEVTLPTQGLKPIVMIGDGGAMIGLLHLVHAAQLNVDITVLLHNNFLFGMTGGQHSAFTPLDWFTATTPEGNSTPPIDLLALLRTAHAGFLARQFATDSDLAALSVGLHSTQKNDNPVTQGSGFSLSEICLSPRPIGYTDVESVDVAIVVSQDGWNELRANGTLAKFTPHTLVLVDAMTEISNPTGRLVRRPFRHEATPKRAALAAVAYWLGMSPVVPSAAWDAVVTSLPVERRDDVSAALRVGTNLASEGGEIAK